MLDALRSEVFRIVRRRMPFVLMIVLAVVIAAIYLITWGASMSGQFSPAEKADLLDSLAVGSIFETGLGISAMIGTLFVIILASSLAATEYGWGTIRTILPRSPGRPAFLAAKLVVILAFGMILMLIGLLASLGMSMLITAIENLESGVASGFMGEAVLSLLRGWFTMLPYAALAFMVALLAKSSAAGISVAAAVLFLEGQILMLVSAAGGFFERLPEAFLSENVQTLLTMGGSAPQDSGLPGPWQAVGVLAAYIVVFTAIAFWRFGRRDVTIG
jgi:ABC-2 type transport system permease protein